MIVVTRLDRTGGHTYAINPDLIERIDENPDTTLHMVDNSTQLVAEPMSEVIELIARYRAYVIALARDHSAAAGARRGPALEAVRPAQSAGDPLPSRK